MSTKLTFVETISIDAFKRTINCNEISIIENPNKAGSLFLTVDSDSNFRGAVAVGKYTLDEIIADPMISKVQGDNGDQFWMLHKRHTSNANVKATL